MNEATSDIVEIAYDALDHVMTLAPRGWRQVVIRRGPVAEGLSVSSLEATPADGPAVTPALGGRAGLRRIWLSGALDDIQSGLRTQGLVWDGLLARFERAEGNGEETAEIVLHLTTVTDHSIAEISLAQPDEGAIVTERLLDLVDREANSWAARQSTWRATVGDIKSWRFEAAERAIEITNQAGVATRFSAEIIGSYAYGPSSWCWAWANRSFPPAHTERIRALRKAVEDISGLSLLRFGGFRCEETFAVMAARLAASQLGGGPLFDPMRSAPPVRLFFYLLET